MIYYIAADFDSLCAQLQEILLNTSSTSHFTVICTTSWAVADLLYEFDPPYRGGREFIAFQVGSRASTLVFGRRSCWAQQEKIVTVTADLDRFDCDSIGLEFPRRMTMELKFTGGSVTVSKYGTAPIEASIFDQIYA